MSYYVVTRSAASQRLAALVQVWASTWDALAPRYTQIVTTLTCLGVSSTLMWVDAHGLCSRLVLRVQETSSKAWRITFDHTHNYGTAAATVVDSLPRGDVATDRAEGVVVSTDAAALTVIAHAVAAVFRLDEELGVIIADAALRMSRLGNDSIREPQSLLDAVLEALSEPFRDAQLRATAFAFAEGRGDRVTWEVTWPGADAQETLSFAFRFVQQPSRPVAVGGDAWCTARLAFQRWTPCGEGECDVAEPEVIYGEIAAPLTAVLAQVGAVVGQHVPERRIDL